MRPMADRIVAVMRVKMNAFHGLRAVRREMREGMDSFVMVLDCFVGFLFGTEDDGYGELEKDEDSIRVG